MRKLIVIGLILLAGNLVHGESTFLVDQGASGVATSGIQAASVSDGSALFYNPAQLSSVNTFDLQLTGSVLFPSLAYSTRSGNTYDSSKKVLTPGSLFLTLPVSSRMTIAVGATTPVMGDNSWKSNFPGRFGGSRFKLTANTISVGAGFRLGERARFGLSADFTRASLIYENRLISDYFDIIGGDEHYLGLYEAKAGIDGSETASGFTAGFSVDLGSRWTVSMVYKSRQEFDFEALPVEFTQMTLLNVPNAVASFEQEFSAANTITTAFDIPASGTIGIAFKPSNRWIIELDYTAMMFSDVRPYYFDYAENSNSIVDRGMTAPWKDMDVYGMSLNYKATKEITLMGGMRYGSDVIPFDDITGIDPSGEKFWMSLGMSHLDEGDGWSFALLFKTYRDETVNGQEYAINPTVPGRLEPMDAQGLYDRHYMGFSFSYHIRF